MVLLLEVGFLTLILEKYVFVFGEDVGVEMDLVNLCDEHR